MSQTNIIISTQVAI